MILTDDSEEGKGNVVAFGRWFRYAEGEFQTDWKTRWEPVLVEDMKIEMLEDFFNPMAKQHEAVMGERAHYCQSLPTLHFILRESLRMMERVNGSSP